MNMVHCHTSASHAHTHLVRTMVLQTPAYPESYMVGIVSSTLWIRGSKSVVCWKCWDPFSTPSLFSPIKFVSGGSGWRWSLYLAPAPITSERSDGEIWRKKGRDGLDFSPDARTSTWLCNTYSSLQWLVLLWGDLRFLPLCQTKRPAAGVTIGSALHAPTYIGNVTQLIQSIAHACHYPSTSHKQNGDIPLLLTLGLSNYYISDER